MSNPIWRSPGMLARDRGQRAAGGRSERRAGIPAAHGPGLRHVPGRAGRSRSGRVAVRRRDRRAGADPGGRRSPRARPAAVRRKAAALRNEPVHGLAARQAPGAGARRGRTARPRQGVRPAGRERARAAAGVRAPRLPLAEPDGLRTRQPGHPRFPGRRERPAHLRPRVPAAGTATSNGRWIGSSIGRTGSGVRRWPPASTQAPTSGSSCAGST